MHISINNLAIIGSDGQIMACHKVGTNYLNQYWNIVKWTLRNKLQWNFNQILTFSFKKIHFKVQSAKWPQFINVGVSKYYREPVWLYSHQWSWCMLWWSSHMLTHWGRDKMAAISQTTLSIAFSWMKILEFQLHFHWSLFLRVQLTKFSRIGSDNGLAPSRRQAIIWINDG